MTHEARLSASVRRPLFSYFLLAFGITWGVGGVCLLAPSLVANFVPGQPLNNPLFFLAVYAPSASALAVTALCSGAAGLRELSRRLLPWRASVQWCLIVLVGYPLVGLLAGRVAGLFAAPQGHVPEWGRFYCALLPALATDPGPLGEELGWRGFALPRLLERWHPLTASLILGLIWGIWHLPAFFIPGLPQSRLAIPALVLATISVSIIDTWIFLRTRGNLLPMILVHLMANHCFKMIGVSFATSLGAGAVCALVIVVGGGLRHSPGATAVAGRRTKSSPSGVASER